MVFFRRAATGEQLCHQVEKALIGSLPLCTQTCVHVCFN